MKYPPGVVTRSLKALSNAASGHLGDPAYEREAIAAWDVANDDAVLLAKQQPRPRPPNSAEPNPYDAIPSGD